MKFGLKGRSRAMLASVGGALIVLLGAGAAMAGPAAMRADSGPLDASAQPLGPVPQAGSGLPERLVVLASGGLRAQDITPETTPALYGLLDRSDFGSVSVRTVGEITCPADGWLTLGTGRRTIAPRPGGSPCDPIPTPQVGADSRLPYGTSGGTATTDLTSLTAANSDTTYDPQLGLLGDAVAGTETTKGLSLAVGPGAALALMDSNGTTDNYRADLAAATRADFAWARLAVVDLGSVVEPGFVSGDATSRAENVAAAEATAAEVLDMLPPRTTVMLVGLSGSEDSAHLGLAGIRQAQVADGADDGARARWLGSASTHRSGLSQLTDALATVCELTRIECSAAAHGELSGVAMAPGAQRPHTAEALDEMADLDVANSTVRSLLAPFLIVMVTLELLIAAFGLALRRRSPDRTTPRWMSPALTSFALLPLAACVGLVVPWWRTGVPMLALVGCILAAWLVYSAVTLCAAYVWPWRGRFLAPILLASLLTAAVLTLDTVLGTPLEWMSIMGDTATVGGRFYGMSNLPLALSLAGMLLGLAAASGPLRRALGKVVMLSILGIVGGAYCLIVAAPAWGANVGGTITAVAAIIVLLFLVSGARLGWKKIAIAVAAGVAVFAVAAIVDWMRPVGSRTHLGGFVQSVIDGDMWTVFWRKIEAAMTIVGGSVWLTLIFIAGQAFLSWVALSPRRFRLLGLDAAYRQAPSLKAGMIAVVVAFFVAILVKDSGVAMPTTALQLVAPLLLGAAVTATVPRDDEVAGTALPAESTRTEKES